VIPPGKGCSIPHKKTQNILIQDSLKLYSENISELACYAFQKFEKAAPAEAVHVRWFSFTQHSKRWGGLSLEVCP